MSRMTRRVRLDLRVPRRYLSNHHHQKSSLSSFLVFLRDTLGSAEASILLKEMQQARRLCREDGEFHWCNSESEKAKETTAKPSSL